ncbi:MAG: hypothetical protein WCX31_18480 [Salinivirgaceae bacterium]|jgi:hypothetical protein
MKIPTRKKSGYIKELNAVNRVYLFNFGVLSPGLIMGAGIYSSWAQLGEYGYSY